MDKNMDENKEIITADMKMSHTMRCMYHKYMPFERLTDEV